MDLPAHVLANEDLAKLIKLNMYRWLKTNVKQTTTTTKRFYKPRRQLQVMCLFFINFAFLSPFRSFFLILLLFSVTRLGLDVQFDGESYVYSNFSRPRLVLRSRRNITSPLWMAVCRTSLMDCLRDQSFGVNKE